MIRHRTADVVFVVCILIACSYFAWVAQGFKTTGLLASSGLPSKFFPQLTLGFIAVCAVLVIVFNTGKRPAGSDKEEFLFACPGELRRGLLMLAAAVACYFIWLKFGLITMAIALGPMSLLAMGIWSGRVYISVLGLTGVVYIVFSQLLGVQFT